MKNEKYFEIRKKYLAEGLAFLGFSYLKFGYGADMTYGFEDTDKFQIALKKYIELRNELNN